VISVLEDYVGGNGLTPVVSGNEKGKIVFEEWANGFVNVEGTKNLNQVLRDIIVNSAGSGDVLITTPIDPDVGSKKVSLRVELTSGARIRTPDDLKNGKKDRFGNIVKMGVAFKGGKEVGYYVQNLKNYDPTAKRSLVNSIDNFTYVPRYDSKTGRFNAYLFRIPQGQMAEQTRGLPILFPVVQEIKDLADLWDSAILGARNKNHLSVAVLGDDVGGIQAGMGGVDEAGNTSIEQGSIIGDILDGSISSFPGATDIKTINSSGMIDLDALFQRSNRYLGSGLGIPVELMFKDFSQTNFSSGKLALDSFFRMTEFWSIQLGELWRFLYELVNVEASLKGFGLRSLNKKTLAVKFVGSQNFVDSDPTKLSKSETERIGNNITTSSRELARRGITYEEICIEKAKEFQIAEAVSERMNVPLNSVLPGNEIPLVNGETEEVEPEEEIDSEESKEIEEVGEE
jgi:capsid protein